MHNRCDILKIWEHKNVSNEFLDNFMLTTNTESMLLLIVWFKTIIIYIFNFTQAKGRTSTSVLIK